MGKKWMEKYFHNKAAGKKNGESDALYTLYIFFLIGMYGPIKNL